MIKCFSRKPQHRASAAEVSEQISLHTVLAPGHGFIPPKPGLVRRATDRCRGSAGPAAGEERLRSRVREPVGSGAGRDGRRRGVSGERRNECAGRMLSIGRAYCHQTPCVSYLMCPPPSLSLCHQVLTAMSGRRCFIGASLMMSARALQQPHCRDAGSQGGRAAASPCDRAAAATSGGR